MIRSMTGYGRANSTAENMEITAEIKAVNHRYFEFSARVPRQFSFLEEKLKAFVNQKVSRGKVEVYITINLLDAQATSVSVNLPLATAYADALQQIERSCSLTGNVSAADIAKFPDVLNVQKEDVDEDAVTNVVLPVMSDALDAFIQMRENEGQRLKADVLARCETIVKAVDVIEQQSEQTVGAYRERLEEKMRELLGDIQVDEQRLLTETAIFADKIAVDEETVRLRSHIDQLRQMLDGGEPVGRKLDFLVQEMNREINTIGSKCSNIEITKIVVDVKSEIEKIREQIQNIE